MSIQFPQLGANKRLPTGAANLASHHIMPQESDSKLHSLVCASGSARKKIASSRCPMKPSKKMQWTDPVIAMRSHRARWMRAQLAKVMSLAQHLNPTLKSVLFA